MDAAILRGLDGVGDLQELAGWFIEDRRKAGPGRISYTILIIADGAAGHETSVVALKSDAVA